MVRNRLILLIQRHVVTQSVGEGREEEEKKWRRAHKVRAERLRNVKRRRDDEDCGAVGKENMVIGMRRRMRRKMRRGLAEGWYPVPRGQGEGDVTERIARSAASLSSDTSSGVYERVLREWRERRRQQESEKESKM